MTQAAALRKADRSQFNHQTVSFRISRLEPFSAWMIAAFALWTTLWYSAFSFNSLFIAACMGLVGMWSQLYPARRQVEMLARSVLLVAGIFLLQLTSDIDTAADPFSLCIVLVLAYYTLLLASPWAAVLGGVVLLECALGFWFSRGALPWRTGMVNLGFLVAAGGLSQVFGRYLRQSDELVEASMRDAKTMLYNEAGFLAHGAELLAGCRAKAKPFSLVLLSVKDLRQIPDLLGRKATQELFAQAVQAIGAIPANGIAARTDAFDFALVLPDMTAERSAALLKRRLGAVPSLVIERDEKSVVIVMDIAIAQAQDPKQTLQSLYEGLRARLDTPAAAPDGAAPGPEATSKADIELDDSDYGGPAGVAKPTVPMPLQPHLRMKANATK